MSWNHTAKHLARLVLLPALGLLAVSSQAQQSGDTKEKERMYSYVALWQVPRAKWTEYAKPVPAIQKILDGAVSDGTLVAYGEDFNLVHSAEGYTHDNWWSSRSMAGILKVLDQFEALPGTGGGVMNSVTKHEDAVLVSRHYNWRAGTYKNAYSHVSMYLLKSTAPDDAVEVLTKSMFEPLLEKLLADGSIIEYEVDEEAIHTQDPNSFWLIYVTPNAEGLDKVNAALRADVKANALLAPTFNSMIDFTPHRDYLTSTNVTYK
jgi:hypothetical protein